MTYSATNSVSDRLTLRPAGPEDRDGICALFQAVHGRPRYVDDGTA